MKKQKELAINLVDLELLTIPVKNFAWQFLFRPDIRLL